MTCPNRFCSDCDTVTTARECPECGEHATECGDEGGCCPPCLAKEEAYWGAYFGQDYGTREEKRARLMAMDPRYMSEEERLEHYDANPDRSDDLGD